LTDVQKVLGHSADIIVAANARDTGISVLATKSPQKTIVVSATKKSISPKTIIVEDNSPQRKSLGKSKQSLLKTLTLESPSTIIVSP